MKKIFTILILSSLFAGELEVDGNLTVTGDINSPSIDALSGMKPDRIYKYEHDGNIPFNFTVPENKFWMFNAIGPESTEFFLNNNIVNFHKYSGSNFTLAFSGDVLSDDPSEHQPYVLSIYEYSISSSGTDQGIDYIVP